MARLYAAWPALVVWQRALLLSAAPLLLALLASVLRGEGLGWLKAALAFVVLLIYPGFVLHGIITGRFAWGRAEVATAFAASAGIWLVLGAILQIAGAGLFVVELATLAVLLTLISVAAVRAPSLPPRNKPAPRMSLWLDHLFFWGGVLLVLFVFAQYASIWRPTDRWTYGGLIRMMLDTGSLQPAELAPNISLNMRLELSPWLVQLAMLVRLSGVSLPPLYSLYLPPLLLFVALCAAYALARTLLATRWAAGLAVALLSLVWLADIAVPALDAFPWEERMLLRIVGGEASVGQWALLGRIIEDKFLLLYVLLPAAWTWMLLYLLHGGRRKLLLLAIILGGVAVVHPLGIVYFAFGYGLFALLRCVQRPLRPTLSRALLVGGLVLLGSLVPALQSVSLAADTAANTGPTTQPLSGQAFLDVADNYGLWVAPWSEHIYAAHPYLLLRRPWLIAAVILLLLLALRGWRRPTWQFLAGTIGSIGFVAFNPLLAPWLALLITRVLVPRMAWPLLLPGVIVLSWALENALAFYRLRRGAAARRWAPAMGGAALLLGLLLWQGPRIASGLGLLAEIQSAALSPSDIDMLQFLRNLERPGSTVLAEEWLTNELPAFVGSMHGIAFRGKDTVPGSYTAVRSFYLDDQVDVAKLQILDRFGVDLVVVPQQSAARHQLAQLEPFASELYANQEYHLFELQRGWQNERPILQLLAAGEALAAGDPGSAQGLAEEVIAGGYDNITARQVLAQALARQNRIDEALAVLDAIPANEETAAALGNLRAGVYGYAADFARSAGASAEELAELYQTALAANPDNTNIARALVATAAAAPILSDEEEEKLVNIFVAAAAPEANPLSYLRRRALWDLATVYELLRRESEAEAAYRRALALTYRGETEGGAAERLGRFLVRQGRTEEAKELYLWAIDRNVNAAVLYAALADLQVQLGQSASAQAVWRAAATANPWAPWPYLHAGAKLLQEQEQAEPANEPANEPVIR